MPDANDNQTAEGTAGEVSEDPRPDLYLWRLGAAGGGKSFGLLLTTLRYKNVPGFGATIFRRNYSQIYSQGGLWDEATKIFSNIKGAHPRVSRGEWLFEGEDGKVISKIAFAHLENDDAVQAWQGSQICELCLEENTPVLLADGTYRPISNIRPGDMVQTLQGPREVTAVGIPRQRECVQVELPDGRSQIQSADHRILTRAGWASYQDMLYGETGPVLRLRDVALYQPDAPESGVPFQYVHPYTGEVRSTDMRRIRFVPLKLTHVGKRTTVDITVASENHYISECGFVNVNCFDELCHFCLTSDTEVLTNAGWKNITEVQPGDVVPSLAVNGGIEMKEVLDTPSFNYDGEMIEIDQRQGISVCMTPNHRVPVHSQSEDPEVCWRFINAETLTERVEQVMRAGTWNGGTERTEQTFELPSGRGIGSNANVTDRVPMDDWLTFLGWYMAEGSAFLALKSRGGTSPCISIRQTKENAGLKALMGRLPWRVVSDGDGGYRIYSRQLYDVLKPLGNQYERRIPRWLFSLTRRQQALFFNAFMAGDGQITKTGSIQLGLSNEGLTDDLQEMCTYLGLCATKGHYLTGGKDPVYTLSITPGCMYSEVRPESVQRVPYRGKVYCLTVADNHTFLVRRNGRTHWTGNSEKMFFYMLSRNRSTCGVPPFVRATCNPDAESWVADFISWWIDQDTGYPIPERSGKLRWFVRRDEVLHWASSREELWEKFNLRTEVEKQEPRSVTFIMSSVEDNKELLKINPQYVANLKALSVIDRERLLYGNWKIKSAAGLYFKAADVSYLPVVPADVTQWVRCWDLAATERSEGSDPAYTAGVLIGKRKNGRYVIADVINRQMSAADVRKTILQTAQQDKAKYKRVRIRIPKDPGQAGKEQAQSYIKFLAGYDVTAVAESGSKEARATPMAAQWQAGNFDLVVAPWNEPYLLQLEGFPSSKFKDMVDASANGFAEVELRSQFNLSNLL